MVCHTHFDFYECLEQSTYVMPRIQHLRLRLRLHWECLCQLMGVTLRHDRQRSRE
jgi:hypothetical protein